MYPLQKLKENSNNKKRTTITRNHVIRGIFRRMCSTLNMVPRTLVDVYCIVNYLHAIKISQAREKHHFLIDNKITSSTIYRQETFHLNLRSLSLLSPHKLVRCMCHKLSSLQKNIWEDNKQGVTKRWWFVKIIKQQSFGLQKFYIRFTTSGDVLLW